MLSVMMNPSFAPPPISDCLGSKSTAPTGDPLLGASVVNSSTSAHCGMLSGKPMDSASGGASTLVGSQIATSRNSAANSTMGFWNCNPEGVGASLPFTQSSVPLTPGYYCYGSSQEPDRKTAAAAAFKIWPTGYDVHHHANTMAACQSGAMDMYSSPFHHQAWPYNPYHQAQAYHERSLHQFQVINTLMFLTPKFCVD